MADGTSTQESKMISIRPFKEEDIPTIISAFASNNWPKPSSTFEEYLEEQQAGKRIVWLAHSAEQFAGYVTLVLQSKYEPFRAQGIPEIMDLNVLPSFRNFGVGSKLLATAESEVTTKGDIIGLGVGLYADYGPAQRLYVARGYVPDGNGITYNYTYFNWRNLG
jgi:GNAT superfamily N-acetyltransferase